MQRRAGLSSDGGNGLMHHPSPGRAVFPRLSEALASNASISDIVGVRRGIDTRPQQIHAAPQSATSGPFAGHEAAFSFSPESVWLLRPLT